MNPFEFVLGVIIVFSVFRIIRFKMGDPTAFDRPSGFSGHRARNSAIEQAPDPETDRLKDEVKQLKERLHVLERIAVEKENSVARQIDELRDR